MYIWRHMTERHASSGRIHVRFDLRFLLCMVFVIVDKGALHLSGQDGAGNNVASLWATSRAAIMPWTALHVLKRPPPEAPPDAEPQATGRFIRAATD